ncbi:MAG: cyclase family protein [Nitratireductor sp.]
MAEVREGLTFCLSLPLDYPGGDNFSPGRLPPRIRPTDRRGKPFFLYDMNEELPGACDVVNDDSAEITLQYSTHWDALCHIGYRQPDGRTLFFNGVEGGREICAPRADGTSGVTALGIEKMAESCVQARAVMLDLHAHFSADYHPVSFTEVEEIMRKDGVEVEAGDILLIHTGMAGEILRMGGTPDAGRLRSSFPAIDGADRKLQDWITDSGIAAIAADNHAVEFMPARRRAHSDDPAFPLHEHCLFRLGVHLGELWLLTPLAEWLRANRRSKCLLTAPPLRLPGAAGSPVTPVATV